MKVTIRGARGSIPTPLRPAEVREKIVSAILNLSKIQDEAFREELIAAILESDRSTAIFEQERRELVETYLDHLSPLAGITAGGNTACIEVRSASDDVFILDAGSGIRQLGLELMQGPCGRGQGVVHLFFSHPHWDHIQGFPFFRPAFVPGNKIYLYGVHDIEVVLRRQQEFITFPVSLDYMQADLHFVRLEPGETLDFGDLRVRCKPNHHPGDSFAYRFEEGGKAFVYATDASYPAGIDLRPHLDFFDDANLLIFDSQFTQRESDEKEDWGHSSSFVGIEMAQAARVENLLIYHYDPTYTDAEIEKILADAIKFQQNQYSGQKPVNILLAKENQTFDLTPAQGVQLQQVPGGNVAILKPAGIFDELVVAALKVQLEALKQSGWPCQLIIDMSEVDLLQVAGLRALVKLHKEMTGGAHLALAGPSINVQQLIELAGYLDFFAIYPSTHAALNVLRARETLNLPGQILKNRYTIQSKIGEGFLGVVFKAIDTRLDRPVAVKVLSASFSEEAIEQFLEQGRQIVALNHPNIVNVYDCDDEHGLSFMVEELVEGKLLDTLLAENSGRPVSLDIALDIAHDITLGLEYAHTHGVIHGDLKPKNVLLADRVKISDFGLGHLDSGKSLLNLDAPLVNVHYLAPEQVLGHPIDGRTDLYALGVILYELFTGQRPFEGTDQEVLEHHRRSVPRPPRELNPGLSPSLDHLVLKLLDKDPNRRYASAYRVRCILESIVPPTARHAWPALVGRDKPLQRLLDLWAETQQGRGQLVFVSGKAGSGKTRLARALVQAAGEAVVLSAVCPPPPTPAYQLFMEAVTTRLAAAPEPDPLRSVLQELAVCVPEMAVRLSLYPDLCNCEPPVSGPSPVSLAQTLAKATQSQPWLLILDDLHQADPSSLHLLRYLAGHCEQMKLMMVGLYTPAEAGQPNPLADLLTDLKRDAAPYTTLALEPLPQAKTKELLENLWAQPVPLDLAAAIHRRTQGNPLYAGEVARGLIDEGIVTRRDSKWRLTAVVEGELPQNLAETVARRANRLNRVTQNLLYQAVTLGQTFYFEDLREMSDLAPGEVLENLDILLERQLLEEDPIMGVLRFKHPAIHQALADHISQSKRRLLHREAADSLELRHTANTASLAAILAHHFNQAEAFDKVIPYSLQAAQQAEALFAAPTALVWYDLALAALDHQPAGEETDRQRFNLLLARERLYHRRGQRKAQAADLTALHTLAAQNPAWQAAAHSLQAEYERALGRLAAATDAAQAGLEAARQAKSQTLEAEALVQLGRIAALQGNFTAVHDHLYAARQFFVTLADQPGEARCLNGLAGISMHLNDYAEAEADYQQALTMSRAAGDRPGQTITLNNLGRLYVQTGNYTDAFTALNQALTLNRLMGCRQGEAVSLHYLALTYQAVGHYDTARAYLEQALSIRRAIEDCQGEAEDLRALGLTHLALGDCQAARDYIGQALEIFQSTKIQAYAGDTWLMLGLALEGLNDVVKARHAYEQSHLSHEKTGNEAGFIEAHAGLARCLLIAGQLDEAKTEIEVCLTWLKPHGALGINYPLRLYLAAYGILQAAGSPAAADEALQAGQALLRKLADGIEDDELRRSFLEKVEENRELVRL